MLNVFARSSVVVGLLVVISAGCVSPERKPAVNAVSSLNLIRTELTAGKANIDEAVAAIGELEARPADLNPAYNRYKTAVAAVERRAKGVQTRVQDMRARSVEYRESWSQENAQITDPNVRATAEERRERVARKYDAIDQQAQDLRQAYDPFLAKLRDAQTLLANDLTYPGIQAAKPAFDEIRSSATVLRTQVDELIAQIDDGTQRLAPTSKPVN